MKILDVILFLLLLFGAFRGFIKGFLMEVVGIFALIIAIWAGIKLTDWGVGIISSYLDSYKTLFPYLAFFLIFFIVLILINLIGKILKGALHLTFLGVIDNLAGAVLGLLKWAFAISLLFWFAEGLSIPITQDIKENTYIYPLVSSVAPATINFLSENIDFMKGFFNSLNEIFRE